MQELANCSRCNAVFVKTVRDICRDCYEAEERAFEKVYQYLSKRENREATLKEIVKATNVEEELIIKFIKEKRLRTSQFPKLAYPCEQCGVDIVSGRLCGKCSQEMMNALRTHDELRQRKKSMSEKKADIYYTLNKHKKP